LTTATIIAISTACGAVAYAGMVLGAPDYLMLVGLFLPVGLHISFVVATTRTGARSKRPASVPLLRVNNAFEPRGQGRS
jgi:hypothetical protein